MHIVSKVRRIVLITLLTFASLAAAQTPPTSGAGTVRGRIMDPQSHAPVGQVEIVVVGTSSRGYSEDDGRFVLTGVPTGSFTISFARMGYAPLRRNVTLADGGDITLEIELTPNAVNLEGVTVTPGSFSFMGKGVGVRQTMSREDVEAVPQLGNDIFRAVNRLPGLSSNDYAAHFGIRGGRHDETLILLDGLELYEPYHLKDFNEGAVSIIDAETIEGVQLMTGGFPARYGNKRSGVFDVTSRVPEPDQTRLDLGVSFMNTRAMIRGPMGRGSWLAFGRTGYMGLVFQFIDQADLPKPEFEDVFTRLSYPLTVHHELTVDVLHAGDRYTYDIPATTGFSDTIMTREIAQNHYSNSYIWSTIKSTLGPRTTVRTMFSAGIITRERQGSEKAVLLSAPYYALSNDRHYSTFGFAQDWTRSVSDRFLVSVGTDIRRQRNTDSYQTIVYQDPDDPEPPPPGEFPIITNAHNEKAGTRLAFYVSNRWRPLNPLVLETGGRFDRADWTGDSDWSPRASAALTLGHGMTGRVGWGFYRQMQGIDDVSALNGPARYYRSERSEQWTAGWDRVGAKGDVVRVEGYLKRGSQLRPVFRNWKGAIDAFPEPNEDRILVFPRENKSKGVEVYFDRPLGTKLTARASYAYAITDEEVTKIENVNSTDPVPYDLSHSGPQDQRHAANADLTFRTGRWTLNGSFAFHSGWPSTLEQMIPVINGDGIPDIAIRPIKIYGSRLPDYLRFDMRASRKWPTHWGDFGASLEVINATNNSNVFGYDYFKIKDGTGNFKLEQGDETWFSIFPSLGITWSRSF